MVFDFVFWGLGFLRLGTAGLTAQAVGAGDPAAERGDAAARAAAGAGAGPRWWWCCRGPSPAIAFAALGATPAVTAAARGYYDIRVWSAPFALVNYVVLGAVIGRGRTDLGLALQVLINLSNIALNVALVAGVGLGVRGSAFGTLLAEASAPRPASSCWRGCSGGCTAGSRSTGRACATARRWRACWASTATSWCARPR